jgi:O-antigen/teichoic acid export membrane protein
MVSDTTAGVYGVAYRFIDVASFVTVIALLYASHPMFFQEGRKGLVAAFQLARRLLLPALIMVSGAVLCLVFCGPWVITLLGEGFRNSYEVLLWLLPIPFLRVLHIFPADVLTGSGYQGLRTGIQLMVAALNLIMNLLLIPLWGWRGAAVASWVSDGILALGLWVSVMILQRREADRARKAQGGDWKL